MVLEVQDLGSSSSDGLPVGTVPRKSMASYGKGQKMLISLPLFIKPVGFNGDSAIMTLFNPNLFLSVPPPTKLPPSL